MYMSVTITALECVTGGSEIVIYPEAYVVNK